MAKNKAGHAAVKAAGVGAGLLGARAGLGHLLSHTIAGAAGGALVVAASSPAVRRAARRAAVAALARGIMAGRSLARMAEDARLQAEDLVAEAQLAAGPPPAPGGEETDGAAPEPHVHAH